MKTHRVRWFLAALLVLSIPAAQSLAQEAKVNNTVDIQKAQEDQAFALGIEAFICSYPTVVTAVTAEVGTSTDKPLPNGHAPFNSFPSDRQM